MMKNWSEITVEGTSEQDKRVLIVFSFSFETTNSFNRNIQFIVGKVVYGKKYHFPNEFKVLIKIDIKGQTLSSNYSDKITEAILFHLQYLELENEVIIEYML